MDLYTYGTPNGQKISIALEELGLPYRTHKVDITKGEQFSPEFAKVNPNGKIPALVDEGTAIFESVAILVYLAEKTGRLMPKDPAGRWSTISWCLFQAAGLGPMMGQLGHFKVFAKEKIPYAIDRYSNEVNRMLGVMEKQLSSNPYLAGAEYSIADVATWPWIRGYMNFYKETIDESKFPSVMKWYRLIEARPAVQKGLAVP